MGVNKSRKMPLTHMSDDLIRIIFSFLENSSIIFTCKYFYSRSHYILWRYQNADSLMREMGEIRDAIILINEAMKCSFKYHNYKKKCNCFYGCRSQCKHEYSYWDYGRWIHVRTTTETPWWHIEREDLCSNKLVYNNNLCMELYSYMLIKTALNILIKDCLFLNKETISKDFHFNYDINILNKNTNYLHTQTVPRNPSAYQFYTHECCDPLRNKLLDYYTKEDNPHVYKYFTCILPNNVKNIRHRLCAMLREMKSKTQMLNPSSFSNRYYNLQIFKYNINISHRIFQILPQLDI